MSTSNITSTLIELRNKGLLGEEAIEALAKADGFKLVTTRAVPGRPALVNEVQNKIVALVNEHAVALHELGYSYQGLWKNVRNPKKVARSAKPKTCSNDPCLKELVDVAVPTSDTFIKEACSAEASEAA